jgi:hypothetical protein
MNESNGMSDALAAALIQISSHAERIGGLDARETAHFEDITSRLRDLTHQLTDGAVDKKAILASLDDLGNQVTALTTRLAEAAQNQRDADSRQFATAAAPKWWKMTRPQREHALNRLRAWVEQIYQPGYGQLAALLPACWERHPACLYTLDWLSELWTVLYLAPQRDAPILAAQAEWHTRLLPAAANQMASEATSCGHSPDDPTTFFGVLGPGSWTISSDSTGWKPGS